ncbi:MAG: tyrosine-type recombinase/integrase [Methyloligellaceae bacterium]
MIPTTDFAPLLERFFTQRLMTQRQVSPHTIASYRDTFRLFVQFAHKQLKKPPSALAFSDIDPSLVETFLDDLERRRGISARSRNLRLSALRSFFHCAAYFEPAHAARLQQILAIPAKRHDRRSVGFLSRDEVEAMLAAPDRQTWVGRRDHAWLLVAFQTGLRLSEMTGLCRTDLVFDTGAHIRCLGKGRKERCTPLTEQTVAVLKAWLKEPACHDAAWLFPTVHGRRMSADAVQYLFTKYSAMAQKTCPSLAHKRVTPHMARHTAAMALLEGGVEPSVIALFLGHESIKTTQMYLDAHLALKEAALEKTTPLEGQAGRFRADDRLLQFLNSL